MTFDFRRCDLNSRFAKSSWSTASGDVDRFLSVAVPHWELVFTQRQGRTLVTLRGPETKATWATCPSEAEFVGIQFKLGVCLSDFRLSAIRDRSLALSGAAPGRFWLARSSWEVPTIENADVFLSRLEREGLLRLDPEVDGLLGGQPSPLSLRSLQRRLVLATGLTLGQIRQIERANRAADRLRAGASISAVVESEGYSDQSHLTRAMQRFVGRTPRQLQSAKDALSLV